MRQMFKIIVSRKSKNHQVLPAFEHQPAIGRSIIAVYKPRNNDMWPSNEDRQIGQEIIGSGGETFPRHTQAQAPPVSNRP